MSGHIQDIQRYIKQAQQIFMLSRCMGFEIQSRGFLSNKHLM